MNTKNKIIAALASFWRKRRISLITAVVLIIGIVIFGLHDVGIVFGILAATVIMVELTYRWRRIRNFIILFFASFLGVILLAFLDVEVVKPFVRLFGGAAAVNRSGFQVFNQIVSLIILFFGVAGVATGFWGAVALSVWRLAALLKRGKTEVKT